MFDFFRNQRGAVYGDWPKTPEGDFVKPAFLLKLRDRDGDLDIIRGMLESFGIPNVVRYPRDGEFGNVIMGTAAFGAEILVPETVLEEAKNLLHSEIIESEEE